MNSARVIGHEIIGLAAPISIILDAVSNLRALAAKIYFALVQVIGLEQLNLQRHDPTRPRRKPPPNRENLTALDHFANRQRQ